MRRWAAIGATISVIAAVAIARSALQSPAVPSLDEKALREYAGVYQWGPDAFVYLQPWSELTSEAQLTAFDESGDVRTLFPGDRDRFVAGPGAAVATSVESRIDFQRDAAGQIVALRWERGGASRTARRVAIERHEDVRFSNGDVRLAGTLIAPHVGGPHPAIILVHGSGPATRDWTVPFARFLVRSGIALLGYDKRGVGGSSGDWHTASFEDLAGDVVAAFEYLRNRRDIDRGRIGLLGISQAGWVMPIAAVRAKDIAFLINVSGAGVPAEETTIDHARNEMTANGMRPQVIEHILEIMKLQYHFARTGDGWNAYTAALHELAARIGPPPADKFPATQDHPYWHLIRQLYFYDPAPTLHQLQTPTLSLFGELDNNILAEKNRAAWERALTAAGNRDYTLRVLSRANHLHLEATVGNNAEMASLRRFVPAYAATIQEWLAKRLRGKS